MEHNKTYVQLLINSLEKKSTLLSTVIQITSAQESILSAPSMDMDAFEQTIEEKEGLIQQIQELDDGFEAVYARVQGEFQTNKKLYVLEICKLQALITKITDQSVKLQALEARNKNRFDIQTQNKRKEIQQLKVSNETASNYYKNMSNQHQGQSYFLDKKK